jgi:acetyltransferase-like isoleucine patch superfamily enzyme
LEITGYDSKERHYQDMKTKRFFKACAFYCYNNFLTNAPFYCVRHWYLRHVLKISIGPGASVHMGCFITGNNITVGARSVINRNSFLDGRCGLAIGSNVSISPHVFIVTLDHDPQSKDFMTQTGPVRIDDYVWVGARATLLPGVRIGKGAVIGAGALVTKDVAEFTIAAGVPAKPIGQRCRDLTYDPSYFPFFNTDILPD